MFKRFLPELRKRSQELKRPVSISDMMEDFWKHPFEALPSVFREADFPSLDISEGEKDLTVTAELPGMDPKDMDITIRDGVLTIKGEKKFEEEHKEEDFHRIERSYGSFQRSIRLPAAVDESGAKASFKKGVLKLVIPKSDKPETGTKITVEN